jgi:uncharacterized protein
MAHGRATIALLRSFVLDSPFIAPKDHLMRSKLSAALKEALKAKETVKVSTLRLILAAVKDREIAMRGEDKTLGDEDILLIMQKMIRQRQESSEVYEKAGRRDLAEQERAEIAVIEQFLPVQMGGEEIRTACKTVISELDAAGLKDMGRVMNTLKERYAGQMDFKEASACVKEFLQ